MEQYRDQYVIAKDGPSTLRRENTFEALRHKKDYLEQELDRVNHALDLMEKNPTLVELLIAVEEAR